MQSFFQWIYGLFNSWYGQGLYKYLAGYNCEQQATITENALFKPIGIWTLIITAFVCIAYYYIINHPRFNRWWSWLIMLGIAGVSNFILAFSWIYLDFNNGDIMDCLITSESGSTLIGTSNIIMFGLVNFVVSAIFYISITFLIKWGSRNCKHSPLL